MTSLRVAILHNRYVSANPSGENVVVEQETELLQRGGHVVIPYIRDSDEIAAWGLPKRATLPLRPTWAADAVRDVDRLIQRERPDVVHLHNPYPLISPAVVASASRRGVPVVQTLHNYRHACMKGTLFLDGAPCERCLGRRVPLPGVRHGCYRDSRAQSAVMAASLTAHHQTWRREIARYLVLTEFMADVMARHGLPRERMVVRPHAVTDPGEPAALGRGALFVGRFDTEKGVDVLVEAWSAAGIADTLTLIGDGPLLDHIRRAPGLVVMGRQDSAGVAAALRAAALVVIPSRWYEGMTMVAAEAMAAGRPLLVTDVGAMPEVIGPAGWVVPATVAGLAEGLRTALSDRTELERRGQLARHRYLVRHTESELLRTLESTYRAVMGEGRT